MAEMTESEYDAQNALAGELAAMQEAFTPAPVDSPGTDTGYGKQPLGMTEED